MIHRALSFVAHGITEPWRRYDEVLGQSQSMKQITFRWMMVALCCICCQASARRSTHTGSGQVAAIRASAPDSIVEMGRGEHHGCALFAGGSVRCWGNNDYGQLGSGTTEAHAAAMTLEGIGNAVSFEVGPWVRSIGGLEALASLRCSRRTALFDRRSTMARRLSQIV